MLKYARQKTVVLVFSAAFFGGSYIPSNISTAQESIGQETAPLVDPAAKSENEALAQIEPKTEAFQKATADLRQHLQKMYEGMMRFHSSVELGKARKYQEEVRSQIPESRKLYNAFIDAALLEYQTTNDQKEKFEAFFKRVATRSVKESRYELALRLLEPLMQSNLRETELEEDFLRVTLNTSNYDLAEPLMKKIVESGSASDDLQMKYQNLDKLRAEWQEELAARKNDAAGEPLPVVRLTTTKGDVVIELFENNAPETVANFISLVESGFYDTLPFHRVIEHFAAQGGDPNRDGSGGPGYTIYSEADRSDARRYFRGSVGMALSSGQLPDGTTKLMPESGGSQFFISFGELSPLNGQYTVFGRVIEGMDTVASLTRIDPEKKDKNKDEPPAVADEIIRAEVVSKRNHEYKPHKVESN